MGGCGGQGRNMGAEKKCLAIFDDDIAFFQVDAPLAQAFDLPSFQRNARLVAFLDKLVVAGQLVAGNDVFIIALVFGFFAHMTNCTRPLAT